MVIPTVMVELVAKTLNQVNDWKPLQRTFFGTVGPITHSWREEQHSCNHSCQEQRGFTAHYGGGKGSVRDALTGGLPQGLSQLTLAPTLTDLIFPRPLGQEPSKYEGSSPRRGPGLPKEIERAVSSTPETSRSLFPKKVWGGLFWVVWSLVNSMKMQGSKTSLFPCFFGKPVRELQEACR